MYHFSVTLLLTFVSIVLVSANPKESSNATGLNRFKRYHHQHNPENWGSHYEPQHAPDSYDVHYNYHDSYSNEHHYQYKKPDTHYGVPNSGSYNNGQLSSINYPGFNGFPNQYPSQHTPDYDSQFTHHHGSDYFPHHQHPQHTPYNRPNEQLYFPGQNGFPGQNSFPGQNGFPNQNGFPGQNFEGDSNPTLPNIPPNTGIIGNPNSPNENLNTGFAPAPQPETDDRLLAPSPRTRGDRLGAFIKSNIFGTGFDPNITISPTGVLLEYEAITTAYGTAAIVCDKPFEAPEMPDFSADGRRISETRCFEYIWQLRVRNERESWDRICNNNGGRVTGGLINPSNRGSSQSAGTVGAFVAGGMTAAPEEFPHMAALGWNAVNGDIIFRCGASLISTNFLLTAAHCSTSLPDPTLADVIPKIARIGGVNIGYKTNGQAFTDSRRRRRQASNPDQRDVGITNIIVHEQYDPTRRYYDIALMQLEDNLQFTKNLQPACLWIDIKSSSRIKKAVGAGWGVTSANARNRPADLQVGELDIIDVNTCNNLLNSSFSTKFYGVASHQLCAGKLSGAVDVCKGDSGGPLQFKIQLPIKTQGSMHTIIGVIAAGVGCAIQNTPGVFTRVSSFVDWIEKRVWP